MAVNNHCLPMLLVLNANTKRHICDVPKWSSGLIYIQYTALSPLSVYYFLSIPKEESITLVYNWSNPWEMISFFHVIWFFFSISFSLNLHSILSQRKVSILHELCWKPFLSSSNPFFPFRIMEERGNERERKKEWEKEKKVRIVLVWYEKWHIRIENRSHISPWK